MHTTFSHDNQPVVLHGFERDHIFRTIDHTQTFYEQEMLDYIATLRPDGAVIDVGANIGNHSVYFGLFTDACSVTAVEPYPPVNALLRRNIAANGLEDRVTVLDYAFGSRVEQVGLKPGPARNIGHTKVITGSGTSQVRIDDVFGEDNRVSLLKIDVEGHEQEVLLGATQLLMNHRPDIFVEVANRLRKRKVDRLLGQYGYKLYGVFNGKPTYFYRADT